jgi:hypothetical protein
MAGFDAAIASTRSGRGVGVEMASAVGVVRVDDLRMELLDHSREAPRGTYVDLTMCRQRDQVEPFLHPTEQFAIGVGHQRRAVPDGAQPEYGVPHLALAAAPRLGGVDVEREHR